MLVVGGVTAGAITALSKTALMKAALPRLQALSNAGKLPHELVDYLAKYEAGGYRAPGMTFAKLLQKLIPVDRLGLPLLPARLTDWAVAHGLKPASEAIQGALPGTVGSLSSQIFGAAWTNPATGQVFRAGGSNLLKVGWYADQGSRLSTVASTAGYLRGAGIAGGVISSGTTSPTSWPRGT